MSSRQLIRYSCGLALGGLLLSSLPVAAQTSVFTYQGRLTFQGYSASGNFDLTFKLFDALANGSQIGSTLTNASLSVSNGLFTVTLDFGVGGFPGADRWLELGVRTNGSAGEFATLAPRQQLTSAPYAVTAAGFTGAVQDSQLSANVARLNANQTFVGQNTFNSGNSFVGDGAGVTNLNASNLASGTLAVARIGDGTITSTKIAAGTITADRLAAGVGLPAGMLAPFAGATAPTGWLLCNGAAVLRTGANAALFAAIGTTYGAGDGSTTFTLPDFRGRVPVGVDGGAGRVTANNALGNSGGEQSHTLATAELPSHSHAVGTLATGSAGSHSHGGGTGGTDVNHTHNVIGNTGTDSVAHTHTTHVNSEKAAAGSTTAHSHWYTDANAGLQTSGESADHTHYISFVSGGANSSLNHAHTISADGAHTHGMTGSTDVTGSGSAHNVLQPYQVVNYIIKQ